MKQQQNYHGYVGYTWARQIAQSRLLRGKSVPFPRLVEAYYMLFQTGAVLGRAQANAGAHFAQLFAEPGLGEELAGGFREMGEGLRSEIQSPSRSALFQLAMLQLQRAFGIEGGAEQVFEHASLRVSVKDAASELGHALVLGVALGFTFPELVRHLWSETHENFDRNDPWLQLAHQRGLPEREPVPLEEFEQQVLLDLATFVRAYYPDLVEALGLAIDQ